MTEDPLAELDFEVAEPKDVVDVTKLSNLELAEQIGSTRLQLHRLREMFLEPDQRSEEGKALHSLFVALNIESKRRLSDH